MPQPVRIDSHVHFWRYSPEAYPWIDDTMSLLKRDYLPPELEPLMRAAGFDACIAVQATHTIEETEWLLSLAGEYPFIAGVVGWVDLRSPTVERELERLAAHPKAVGIRHIAQSEPDDFLLHPDFQRGIAQLERFDLAYDLLVYTRQLPAATKLVRRFPRQRFVLDHAGKPEVRARKLEPWATHLRELARSDNVACKLSGLATEADWRSWTPEDLEPFANVTFEAFGSDRVLLGSDWPVCTLAGEYRLAASIAFRRSEIGTRPGAMHESGSYRFDRSYVRIPRSST